ncbi:uncharacterized protein LOC131679552 [Topomyia yanbarensis]|uniref:uncharacterized protein LOC131679552 n=1 Tax=Topomyia yanbarensis TaxID=2498891 RepID=UPI00273AC9F4|nr:uncharacterized protein LOC131679552 [Topomyia yanbarensis]
MSQCHIHDTGPSNSIMPGTFELTLNQSGMDNIGILTPLVKIHETPSISLTQSTTLSDVIGGHGSPLVESETFPIMQQVFVNEENTTCECISQEKTKQEILDKIDQAKEEVVSTVLHAMENIITKTISVVKSDFDAKLALLQDVKPQLSGMANFQFLPISTVSRFEEENSKLENADYAKNVRPIWKSTAEPPISTSSSDDDEKDENSRP